MSCRSKPIFKTLAHIGRYRYPIGLFLWTLLVFALSTDIGAERHTASWTSSLLRHIFPDIGIGELKLISKVMRKTAHVVEYAAMAFLLAGTLQVFRESFARRQASLAIAICALFASLDELHQSLLFTRTPLLNDVFIDIAGAACGILLFFLLIARRLAPE